MKTHDAPVLARMKDVSKRYDKTLALNQLNFELHEGQTLGLLGPNGAGKTTAIHLLLGLLSPTTGNLSVLGRNPIKHRQQLSERINFSSSYSTLPSNLTMIENLRFFGKLYAVKPLEQKLDSLLELFEINHLRQRLTGALSSGERTRMNLCKCFLNDPALVFLDEPTASLDPDIAAHTRSILMRLQQERRMGILYTSHNMHEVETLCESVIFLHRGRSITSGTPEELKTRYKVSSLEDVFIQIVRNASEPEASC